MRQKLLLLTALALLLVLLPAGCAEQAGPKAVPSAAGVPENAFAGVSGNAPMETDAENTAPEAGSAPREPALLRALIVDGAETGELVLALERGVHDVYLLNTASVPVRLDGESADASALRDGMTVELALAGGIPASPLTELAGVASVSAYSVGSPESPGGTAYDLCGLYLQVLEDLWETDPGLNGGAKTISVDLSGAPGGLSEAAQFAVAWVFARRHGAEALTLGYDDLVAQGYLTNDAPEGDEWAAYRWEDGVLLRIAAHEGAEDEIYSLPVVRFDAEKWRSAFGAYFFHDCTAVWPEFGTWSGYQVGAEMIS